MVAPEDSGYENMATSVMYKIYANGIRKPSSSKLYGLRRYYHTGICVININNKIKDDAVAETVHDALLYKYP